MRAVNGLRPDVRKADARSHVDRAAALFGADEGRVIVRHEAAVGHASNDGQRSHGSRASDGAEEELREIEFIEKLEGSINPVLSKQFEAKVMDIVACIIRKLVSLPCLRPHQASCQQLGLRHSQPPPPRLTDCTPQKAPCRTPIETTNRLPSKCSETASQLIKIISLKSSAAWRRHHS